MGATTAPETNYLNIEGFMADIKPSGRLLRLFSVPFAMVRGVIDSESQTEIARWVQDERLRTPGITVSNLGGWHSTSDLPIRGEAALNRLFNAMQDHLQHVVQTMGDTPQPWHIQAWATVMCQGASTQIHDHVPADWSAVFYVDAGDPSVGGELFFCDPAQARGRMERWIPETGQLLLFPGWLKHGVEPYWGQRPRIAIAANFQV